MLQATPASNTPFSRRFSLSAFVNSRKLLQLENAYSIGNGTQFDLKLLIGIMLRSKQHELNIRIRGMQISLRLTKGL
ncbi:3003_t:CDS:2 [Acaulospora colombiana]|uniref:3003_t:CDS:1 n=1 Tax=Acaulospora colombiana TaxID=27376 RepID=A0ACA9KHT8_9GLOM|nr:3003_t:CDS:2 [Acaulospora colombiana]